MIERTDEEMTLREKIVDVSKRLYDRGLVAGAGGNVSAKTSDSRVFVTPSGVCKGYLKASDILEVDLEGTLLKGTLRPTSETPMHTAVYKVRNDVNAIVHAHPPTSTGFACAGVELNYPIFPDSIAMIGDVGTVEYVTPTTPGLAEKVAEQAREHDALLLLNHGTITLGSSLEQAYQRTEILEDYARIVLVSKLLGGPHPLSSEEVARIRGLEAEKYRLRFVKEEK